MQWNDSLNTGVLKIDEQHRALIQAVNDLFAACSQGLGRKKIGETLRFLQAYVGTHFADEEKIQLECGFPEYTAHRKLHADFVRDVNRYVKQFESEGPTIAFVAQFNHFVSDWLIYHISREDRKIGEYIRSKSAASV